MSNKSRKRVRRNVDSKWWNAIRYEIRRVHESSVDTVEACETRMCKMPHYWSVYEQNANSLSAPPMWLCDVADSEDAKRIVDSLELSAQCFGVYENIAMLGLEVGARKTAADSPDYTDQEWSNEIVDVGMALEVAIRKLRFEFVSFYDCIDQVAGMMVRRELGSPCERKIEALLKSNPWWGYSEWYE